MMQLRLSILIFCYEKMHFYFSFGNSYMLLAVLEKSFKINTAVLGLYVPFFGTNLIWEEYFIY